MMMSCNHDNPVLIGRKHLNYYYYYYYYIYVPWLNYRHSKLGMWNLLVIIEPTRNHHIHRHSVLWHSIKIGSLNFSINRKNGLKLKNFKENPTDQSGNNKPPYHPRCIEITCCLRPHEHSLCVRAWASRYSRQRQLTLPLRDLPMRI